MCFLDKSGCWTELWPSFVAQDADTLGLSQGLTSKQHSDLRRCHFLSDPKTLSRCASCMIPKHLDMALSPWNIWSISWTIRPLFAFNYCKLDRYTQQVWIWCPCISVEGWDYLWKMSKWTFSPLDSQNSISGESNWQTNFCGICNVLESFEWGVEESFFKFLHF